MTSRLLILASSRKSNGRCLAGKAVGGSRHGQWMRPIWEDSGLGWSQDFLTSHANRIPQPGDVFTLPPACPMPAFHQIENWRVDPGYWHYVEHANPDAISGFLDKDLPWPTGWDSRRGVNDRIPASKAESLRRGSLRLIHPEELQLQAETGRCGQQLRAFFVYRDRVHNLVVTDPILRSQWLQRLGSGHNGQLDALLCLSLTQAWDDGYCYKLVAGFFPLETQK